MKLSESAKTFWRTVNPISRMIVNWNDYDSFGEGVSDFFFGGGIQPVIDHVQRQQSEKEAEQLEQYKSLQNEAWAAQSAESAIDREFQLASAKAAMDFEHNENEIARAYNTYMSNTAYQRQVEDMRKAGLNPILALTQGGGASTPTASSAHGYAAGGSRAQLDMDQVSNLLQSQMSQSAQLSSTMMSATALILSVVADKFLPGSGKAVRAIGFR